MPEHLIHRNAETVINQLKILNETLRSVAGSGNDKGSLRDIATVLREIRDAIKSPDPGGGGSDTACDDETLEFLDEALKGSTDLNKIFSMAGLSSLKTIAGDLDQKAKARAKDIRNKLRYHAEEHHIELPSEGKLTKAVECAREKTYGRQELTNNITTAAS
ncbi:MAG: hypothetical protein Q8L53_16230 [Aestuariivirga sp.]|nr:hypothetical protein [Aestuariivirga sp.]